MHLMYHSRSAPHVSFNVTFETLSLMVLTFLKIIFKENGIMNAPDVSFNVTFEKLFLMVLTFLKIIFKQ